MQFVLVVEDHPLVAEATATLIERIEPACEVVTCQSAAEATRLVDEPGRRWTRIFLDLSVPGAHGLSLAMELRSRGVASVCCIVSAFDRADFIAQVRRLGFLGYIVKAAPIAELTTALSRAMRGESTYPEFKGVAQLHPRLTRRQTEILELVRAGLSSKQIASRLHLVTGTVNNQVAAAMIALRADSRSHAVARAIELGLITVQAGHDQVTGIAVRRRGIGL